MAVDVLLGSVSALVLFLFGLVTGLVIGGPVVRWRNRRLMAGELRESSGKHRNRG